METINDRIEKIVNERFDGNKAAFSKAIDLPATSLSNYLGKQHRSKPGIDLIQKIVLRLNVDPYWLLTGEKNPHAAQAVANGASSVAVGHNEGNINANTGEGNAAASAPADDTAVLQERIKYLQELLTEKERTIKILLARDGNTH